MARGRMLSRDVIEDERFLEMPDECQNLYTHLNAHTDDDGFLNPMAVMRLIGAKIDSLKILIAKGYLILFPNKVAALRHFKINNQISPSRRSVKEPRPEYRFLQTVGGKYYLKTKSDLDFTAWLSDDFEKDEIPYQICINSATQLKNEEINKKIPPENYEVEEGEKNEKTESENPENEEMFKQARKRQEEYSINLEKKRIEMAQKWSLEH